MAQSKEDNLIFRILETVEKKESLEYLARVFKTVEAAESFLKQLKELGFFTSSREEYHTVNPPLQWHLTEKAEKYLQLIRSVQSMK